MCGLRESPTLSEGWSPSCYSGGQKEIEKKILFFKIMLREENYIQLHKKYPLISLYIEKNKVKINTGPEEFSFPSP